MTNQPHISYEVFRIIERQHNPLNVRMIEERPVVWLDPILKALVAFAVVLSISGFAAFLSGVYRHTADCAREQVPRQTTTFQQPDYYPPEEQ